MSLESIVERMVKKPAREGMEPFKELIDESPKYDSVKDYVRNGARAFVKAGGYAGRILGAVLPAGVFGGFAYYLGGVSGLATAPKSAIAVGSAGVASVGLLPYTIRGFTRLGAATGYVVGSVLGASYGLIARSYKGLRKLFSRKNRTK
jgi:hypothetical protein